MRERTGGEHGTPVTGELWTISQVSKRLKVSVGCIRAWRSRGEGPPAIRVGFCASFGCIGGRLMA